MASKLLRVKMAKNNTFAGYLKFKYANKIDTNGVKVPNNIYLTKAEWQYLKIKAEDYSKLTGKKISVSAFIRLKLFGEEDG